MATDNSTPHKIACHHCDSMFEIPQIDEGQKALCRCCGGVLFIRKKDSINRTVAVALAGLLLFIPSITQAIMGVGAAGVYNEASLIDCITLMINGEFYIIAFCVFLFTIAIPVVRLITALYLSLSIKFNRIKPSMLVFFRSYQFLDNWTMIHVFFLGIIVSMYKLVSLAELNVDLGLFCLVLLLICSTMVSVTLDQHLVWEELEQGSVD